MPDSLFAHVYEVKIIGLVLAQEAINVFHYGHSEELLDPSGWLDVFDGDVVAALLPCVADNYVAQGLTIQEVHGGGQFASKAISEFGGVSGDCLPPYVSWDFTLVRGAARERNGYKRFAAVAESRQANGLATPAALTDLNNLAARMFADIGSTDTGVLTPVIQRETINHVHQSPPKYYTVSGVQYSKIGTQNSRKFGHGR